MAKSRRSRPEREFQRSLIEELKELFPGCIVLKNDPNYIQGIPDLTVLCGPHWAFLEVKKSKEAHKQPNQTYYVNKADDMSIGRFVYPENKEEVLHDLQQAFRS